MKTIFKSLLGLALILVVVGYFLRPVSFEFNVVALGNSFKVEAYTFPFMINKSGLASELDARAQEIERKFSPWLAGSSIVELNKPNAKISVPEGSLFFTYLSKLIDAYKAGKVEGDPFGLDGIQLDPDGALVTRSGSRRVSLGGVEESIIVDSLVNVLELNGVHNAMVKGPNGLSVVVGRKIYEEFETIHRFGMEKGYRLLTIKRPLSMSSPHKNLIVVGQNPYSVQILTHKLKTVPVASWRDYISKLEGVEFIFMDESKNIVKSPNLLNFINLHMIE